MNELELAKRAENAFETWKGKPFPTNLLRVIMDEDNNVTKKYNLLNECDYWMDKILGKFTDCIQKGDLDGAQIIIDELKKAFGE